VTCDAFISTVLGHVNVLREAVSMAYTGAETGMRSSEYVDANLPRDAHLDAFALDLSSFSS